MLPLIVISHSQVLPGEARIIQQLFDEGLECFHLRKPQASEADVRQLLDAIPGEYRHRIALHGFHHLADEYGIRRLHYTEQARMGAPSEEDLPSDRYILSTSVHSIETLQSLPACFSYAFFGPVFNSISKENYPGIAHKDFYVHNEQKAVPVIALGGIDAANIDQVAAMNFDGAAVLGVLWNEPEKAVERFNLLKIKYSTNWLYV